MIDLQAILTFDVLKSTNMKDLVELGKPFTDIIGLTDFHEYYQNVMNWNYDRDNLIKKKSKFVVEKELDIINFFKEDTITKSYPFFNLFGSIFTCSP